MSDELQTRGRAECVSVSVSTLAGCFQPAGPAHEPASAPIVERRAGPAQPPRAQWEHGWRERETRVSSKHNQSANDGSGRGYFLKGSQCFRIHSPAVLCRDPEAPAHRNRGALPPASAASGERGAGTARRPRPSTETAPRSLQQ